MEELPKLLEESPDLTSINLESCEIESLSPLLPWLIKFSNLKELILFGNRLTSIPDDLSQLKTLEHLDISNNLFSAVQDIIPGLSSLPSLIELNITLLQEEDEQILIEALPNLQKINSSEIEVVKEEQYDEESDELLRKEDLENLASIYDEIRDVWHEIDPAEDKKLAADFDDHVKNVIEEFSNVMKQGYSQSLLQAHAMKSKHELYLICLDKSSELIFKESPKMGQILNKIHKVFDDTFRETLGLVFDMDSVCEEKINSMKNDIEKALKENNEILEAADQIEKDSQKHIIEKEILRKQMEEDKKEILLELEMLKEENKKYLDLLIKHSKSTAEIALGGKSPNLDRSRTATPSQQNFSNGKVLSLRQLKEIIDEIYTNKAKFDQKCVDMKLPRETMEKYLMTFLNHKYGLKHLANEYSYAILDAVKRFSTEDNDVTVFGKIYANECDEEFRFVQNQVKETVSELLKMHLRGKFPLKSNGDVQEMLNERLQSYVSEDEWTDIVKYMYNETDADLLLSLVSEVIKHKNYPSDLPPIRGKITREEAVTRREKERSLKTRILYADFLKILLDFQLKGHEKFLSNFLAMFRDADKDRNGMISEPEFRELLDATGLGFEEPDIFRLLQIIDPYDNQQITFSECVALFSTELIPMSNSNSGSQVAILQRLSLVES
ncbi:unnamed protein product [Blepharisma stoltei]|uniref:EF-hand domain-containing protein n=1 Tax=Blepharisma stoltei TaxID=1481888 RepID=A0AAU9IXS8_9CILI|nr:unnamed protein product [Blepharisma stoltei]